MSDDFNEFACPRCQKEPRRGLFLGAQIWHNECLVEDLLEKAKAGTAREEIEKTLKRVKNKDIEQKVGLGAGWPEYQPAKTQEEIEAEYQAELEAAEAVQEAEGSGTEEKIQLDKETDVDESSVEVGTSKNLTQKITQTQISTPPVQITQQQVPSTGIVSPMSFVQSSKMVSLKPAPTNTIVKKISYQFMQKCLKKMDNDIEFGKLLFKMIKEFNWIKIEEEEEDINDDEKFESDQEEPEIIPDESEKSQLVKEKEKKSAPFLFDDPKQKKKRKKK